MLFNSYEFIFGFLPLCILATWLLQGHRAKSEFLLVASLVFYGFWNPQYFYLISLSMAFNYFLGKYLIVKKSLFALWCGIVANLSLLAYYKYAGFVVYQFNRFGYGWEAPSLVLPLAISFFTFLQITYLVDCRRGLIAQSELVKYGLFVTFFPHLIAGPLVHHNPLVGQFGGIKVTARTLSWGLSFFIVGLFKKVFFADNLAPFADSVFLTQAADPAQVDMASLWGGLLCYTLQIYFDFSGYSDMAVGLALIFGIKLPINFDSPYKAQNIIDFWRRWHITLGNFLRDYVYIPLGGGRMGLQRTTINLMVTMLLGGLWHGGSWNFVVWGGIHGVLLVVCHLWIKLQSKVPILQKVMQRPLMGWISRMVTFGSVALAWVFFNAKSFTNAKGFFWGLFNAPFVNLNRSYFAHLLSQADKYYIVLFIVTAFLVTQLAPNAVEIFKAKDKVVAASRPPFFEWAPSLGWAFGLSAMLVIALLECARKREFVYFQF